MGTFKILLDGPTTLRQRVEHGMRDHTKAGVKSPHLADTSDSLPPALLPRHLPPKALAKLLGGQMGLTCRTHARLPGQLRAAHDVLWQVGFRALVLCVGQSGRSRFQIRGGHNRRALAHRGRTSDDLYPASYETRLSVSAQLFTVEASAPLNGC